MAEIESYFIKRGFDVLIYAISPGDEAIFPADEALNIAKQSRFAKGFALQFKQPKYLEVSGRFYWQMEKSQHMKISALRSVYYALPVFLNRSAKSGSLHHLLFWHPGWKNSYKGEAIHVAKTRIRYTPHNMTLCKNSSGFREGLVTTNRALRFGAFVEFLESCSVGLRLFRFLVEMRKLIRHLKSIKTDSLPYNHKDEVVYAFIVYCS